MAHKTEHETEKGTGKHPHKDSEEPYPHTEGSEGKKEASHKGSSSTSHESHSSGKSHSGGESRSSSSDEKSREYKDKDGNIHHHTHTYEEQHKK